MKNRSLLPEISLLVITLLWGLTFILNKFALAHTGPFTLLMWRSILALPFLAAWNTRAQISGLRKDSALAGIGIGITLFGAFALQTVGLKYTTATNSSLLTGVYVVIVPILANRLLSEKFYFPAMVGILLSAVGILVMAGDATSWHSKGDTLTLMSTGFIALQVITVQAWTKRFNPPLMATLQILTMGLLSAIFAAIFESPASIPQGGEFWVPTLITSFFATFVCFAVQAAMQQKTTATRAAIIYITEPFWGALFAWCIGGESISVRTMVGGVILLGGMLAAEYPAIRSLFPRKWPTR